MHIPDGYLSPETAAALYLAAAPAWLRATRQARRLLSGRRVPLVAIFSALSFVIMMFNVPLPGGTSGHAVGGTLAAIVLGPWLAVLTTSIALTIQALFFGDGGILALGANVFNMGVALPFVGYFVYRLLAGAAPDRSPRRAIAAGVASYLALNVSALLTGVELGIQPLLFHDAAGRALYFPYPLQVSVPALLAGHLLVAGFVEAAVTASVLAWLQRSSPELLSAFARDGRPLSAPLGRAWLALLALVLLTPLGLLAPGTAWGEWTRAQLAQQGLGYIPAGFDRFAGLWSAPFSGYTLPALANPTVAYLFSAALGVGLIVAVILALGWVFERLVAGHPVQLPQAQAGSGPEAMPSSPATQSTLPDETPPVAAPARTHDLGAFIGVGARARHRAPRSFVEKTLANLSGALEQALFAEEIARAPGLLQSLDPRVKLIGALLLLLAVSLSHDLATIAALYLLTLPVAAASRVPLAFYFKRVWILMPFFTGIIALPALFNIFTPGPVLLPLIRSPFELAITYPGLRSAALLILRVGASVSIGVLLILTTRWTVLLKSLRVLRVPQSFVLILGMTYRYIYLLLHSANDMFEARASRVVGRLSDAEDRRWLAAGIGQLLARSYALSDEVYLAMQSRGFMGEVRTLDTLAWRLRDSLWLALFAALSLLVIWLGRT